MASARILGAIEKLCANGGFAVKFGSTPIEETSSLTRSYRAIFGILEPTQKDPDVKAQKGISHETGNSTKLEKFGRGIGCRLSGFSSDDESCEYCTNVAKRD